MGATYAWRACEGWAGRRFHLGNNKEVFDAEAFAIYQTLRVLDLRQETGRKYAIFSDTQSAIRRISSGYLGPGQQWARGEAEVCTRLMVRQNRVMVHWVPAHKGVAGGEAADDLAKQAARGSHATASSQSARPGPLRSEGYGSEWGRIAGGSIRGHRR